MTNNDNINVDIINQLKVQADNCRKRLASMCEAYDEIPAEDVVELLEILNEISVAEFIFTAVDDFFAEDQD